jgi:hypothetical protein
MELDNKAAMNGAQLDQDDIQDELNGFTLRGLFRLLDSRDLEEHGAGLADFFADESISGQLQSHGLNSSLDGVA